MSRRALLAFALATTLLGTGALAARQRMQTYEEALDEGRRLLDEGYHGEALRSFQRAERIAGGEDAASRVLVARTYNAQFVFDRAVEAARGALAVEPDEPWLSRARLALGRGLLGQASATSSKQTLREAEHQLRQVLAAALPESNEARLLLGELLLKRNRVAGARELLRAYLEVDPSGADAERTCFDDKRNFLFFCNKRIQKRIFGIFYNSNF